MNILFWFKKAVPSPILNMFRPVYHRILSSFAVLLYGRPSADMVVIGVTGTNGKTSVVEFIFHILKEAGFKAASVSSVYFRIGGETRKNNLGMTMPGRFFLQKFLSEAKNKGATTAVLEITSEGVAQFRHKKIDWDILVLTNIAPEHIESHGSFENYVQAKEKVFAALSRTRRKKGVPKTIVANADDAFCRRFLSHPADKKITYQPSSVSKKETQTGIEFEYRGRVLKTRLIGDFNLANLLAAISVCEALGISFDVIVKAVESISGVPGRMEFIQREPFAAVIDYAHTPDALNKVYETLSARKPSRLICVLGSAGGGRDKWKRKELGRIASQFCQEIILTSEDPYDENPDAIIKEIESGIQEFESESVHKISDRKEAINKAVRDAKPSDAVIITGKGAEPWMMTASGRKIPWNESGVVREAISKFSAK